jgi:hypothetical protein
MKKHTNRALLAAYGVLALAGIALIVVVRTMVTIA